MKNMFMLGLGIILLTTGCRKGDEDPWFSIKTRKARLVGEWTMTSGNITAISTSNEVVLSSTVHEYTEDQEHYEVISNISNYTKDYVIEEYRIKIDNNGTYERRLKKELVLIDGQPRDPDEIYLSSVVERGTWTFLKRNSEYGLKNKEAVVLNRLESSSTITDSSGTSTNTSTYTAFGESYPYLIWEIERLANKELLIKNEITGVTQNDNYVRTEEFRFIQK